MELPSNPKGSPAQKCWALMGMQIKDGISLLRCAAAREGPARFRGWRTGPPQEQHGKATRRPPDVVPITFWWGCLLAALPVLVVLSHQSVDHTHLDTVINGLHDAERLGVQGQIVATVCSASHEPSRQATRVKILEAEVERNGPWDRLDRQVTERDASAWNRGAVKLAVLAGFRIRVVVTQWKRC